MKRISPFILLLIIILMSACDNSREEELLRREADLKRREEQFQAKEADYLALLKLKDSLDARDSITHLNDWPENLVGTWNSKIVCVETSCNEYVIGDVRNDIWEFAQDSLHLHVNVFNKKELIRVYDADYSEEQIVLNHITDSTAPKQVSMKVVLNEINANKISGYRTVKLGSKCSATFTVELSKISN